MLLYAGLMYFFDYQFKMNLPLKYYFYLFPVEWFRTRTAGNEKNK